MTSITLPAHPIEIDVDDQPALLALNNDYATELSWQSPESFAQLLHRAWFARRIGRADALLISFDQDADYQNANFAWFGARYPRFVYIDRVVVASAARGKGYARRLYAELIDAARSAGHDHLVCEINSEPPNPVSTAFHQQLGFTMVGEATLTNGKIVSYYALTL